MFLRQDTRPVKVGNLTIGGSNEVIIQSMCTTKTADVEATV
ncbi:flavodoxin-dependent (E)-4-hydroxy-3-methylbut-2-enyl-diphosphate synthase, partial [Paenibacillus sp. Aloe-11]